MDTLTEIAQQLKDIADKLSQLSESIVKTHGELGNQLQGDVKQEVLPRALSSKQGEG